MDHIKGHGHQECSVSPSWVEGTSVAWGGAEDEAREGP